MEHGAINAGKLASIAAVPQNRHPGGAQVKPQLVSPSVNRSQFKETDGGILRDHPVARDGEAL
jgi:hypothetical protein